MTNGTHGIFYYEIYLKNSIQIISILLIIIIKSGTLNIDELYAMTIKLECPISRNYLLVYIDKFDKNKNGCIEYDEFVRFLLIDP